MLEVIALIGTTLAVAFVVLPFWSFIRVARLTREIEYLRARLDRLEREAASAVVTRATSPVTASAAAGAPPLHADAGVAPLERVDAASTRAPVADDAVVAPPITVPPLPPGLEPAAVHHEPAPPSLPPLPDASPFVADAAAPVAAADQVDVDSPTALEQAIGGRWLLYVGVATLLVGISFFLKYAVDNAWVGETARVVFGVVAGMTLVAGGARLHPSVPIFGQALSGAGVATLYLAVYAAFSFYALIAPGTAFVAMITVTLLGVGLADRLCSEPLALIAGIGGYATPFLIGGDSRSPVPLFSYDLLLGTGVLSLVHRHRWLLLATVSYTLTVVTVFGWLVDRYTDSQWGVTLALLTALCALFVVMRRAIAAFDGHAAATATLVLWTAPVLYHLTAVALVINHPPALHIYLIAATTVAMAVAPSVQSGLLRVLLVIAGYVPLFAFLEWPVADLWIGATVVTATALAALHVMALLDRILRQAQTWSNAEALVLHVALIGVFGVITETLGVPYESWRGTVALILAVCSGGIWWLLRGRDALGALHAGGLALTFVALAIAEIFEGPLVIIGWAVEGAVVGWLGVRGASPWLRAGGVVLWALAAGRVIDLLDRGAVPGAAFMNWRSLATLAVVALGYILAWWWRDIARSKPAERLVPIVLHVAGSVLTMVWLSVEIDAYWSTRTDLPQARLSEELSRSLAWGIYGAALVAIGFWKNLSVTRWIGMAAIALTVLKVFLVDLSELGGIYRVIGFLILGLLLVAVSYLYQQGQKKA